MQPSTVRHDDDTLRRVVVELQRLNDPQFRRVTPPLLGMIIVCIASSNQKEYRTGTGNIPWVLGHGSANHCS